MQTSRLAFLYSVPIAILGGLIGLGGAEFRLPVLAGPLGYSARRAVPLNLAVSLVTIVAAFLIRGRVLSLQTIGPLLPAIFALISGAVVAAFYGPSLAHKLSDERLERVILVLLLVIGLALIVESFLPQETAGLLPSTLFWHVCAGIVFGLGIGLVSSLLGVAGGEMIIPTLVFAFGANIKTAGTASLLISFPTICVGLLRYAESGAFSDRQPLIETVAPMGIGSIIGAVIGGVLVGIVPVPVLKLMLGVILIISALRIFSKSKRKH
ncbi:MAG TPA: sulfite exporter TauE/SafE family protein [Blastocatellia bacterium]|nr:sulfite exporter TauE/SafE family protein [Blastocatellia bacterium]